MAKEVKNKTYQSTGKRKSAIAKATLYPEGKGIVRINSVFLEAIPMTISKERIREPLTLAENTATEVDIDVKVRGGGWQGQTEASRLAIARVLSNYNKKLKKVFLDYDRHLLIQDVRFKETRKPNDSKARAARQKSYR